MPEKKFKFCRDLRKIKVIFIIHIFMNIIDSYAQTFEV